MTRTGAIAASVLVAVLATLGTAVLMVIPLVIVELYQAGHNLPELTRPWIDSGGVRLSRADALFLAGSAAGGLFAGMAFHRVFSRRGSGPPPAPRS